MIRIDRIEVPRERKTGLRSAKRKEDWTKKCLEKGRLD